MDRWITDGFRKKDSETKKMCRHYSVANKGRTVIHLTACISPVKVNTMGQIIVPKNPFRKNGTPFADLVRDKQAALKVARAMMRAINGSFAEDENRMSAGFRSKIETETEAKRRADILGRWFRTMRCEMSYSTERAISEMTNALRAELNGDTYTPPEAKGMFRAAEGEA